MCKIIYFENNTICHSSFIGFNRTESTGVIILLNFSMLSGSNIEIGKEIMTTIMKN